MEFRKLTASEFAGALAVRLKVFVDEQKVPLEEERDHYDDIAIHFGAITNGDIVGTGRLVVIDNKGKIGRMAVLPEYRDHGVGLGLLSAIVDECRKLGLAQAYLSSQTHAIPFYEKLGFVAEGGIYPDAGIPHRDMRLVLTN